MKKYRFPVLIIFLTYLACAAFTWLADFDFGPYLPKAKPTPPVRTLDWDAPPTMCAPPKPTAFAAMPLPWGGIKPVTGDNVTIPVGMHVLLDEDTPPLAGLTIEGILEFDQQDLELTAHWIMVMGELHIGSEATPFTHEATITLNATDPNENIMNMGTRGIMVMGGQLEMHGTPPAVPWTKINAHAMQGSNSLTLMETVNWSVGDQVAIAPTDYYQAGPTGNSITQRLGLTAVGGNSLTLDGGLNAHRWGVLQYATTNG